MMVKQIKGMYSYNKSGSAASNEYLADGSQGKPIPGPKCGSFLKMATTAMRNYNETEGGDPSP